MTSSRRMWVSPVAQKWFYFIVFVLVVFPKGGIVVSGIPITWGYLLLAMGAFAMAPLSFGPLLSGVFSMRGALILAFPVYASIVLWVYGATLENAGMILAFFVATVGMPMLLFLWCPAWLGRVDPMKLARYLRWLLLIVSAYGLVGFLLRNYYGQTLFIPYLTTGVAEFDDVLGKHNMRGDVSKLVSTYNNGNIFGICVLLLLPLADLGKTTKNWLYVAMTRGALVFTLSRTVWIGLLLYELISGAYIRRIKVRTVVILGLLALGVGFAVSVVLGLDGAESSFLLDSTLGGRIGDGAKEYTIEWVSTETFIGIREIVYLGVLEGFGLVGLVLFLPHFFAPWLILALTGDLPRSDVTKSCLVSIFVYNILAFSDGAYLLIPVSAFYWFVAGFLYAHRGARDLRPGVQPVLRARLSGGLSKA